MMAHSSGCKAGEAIIEVAKKTSKDDHVGTLFTKLFERAEGSRNCFEKNKIIIKIIMAPNGTKANASG